MTIYLFGPDSYRRQEKLKEIADNYRQKHSFFSENIFSLEKEGELDRLVDYSGQTALFSSKKMAVILNSSELKVDELKRFEKLLKANIGNEDLILILSNDKELPKDFSFLLGKPTIHQEFLNLSESKLEFFINQEAKKRALSFHPRAITFLANAFKNNSWGLITELDRLMSFKSNFGEKDLDQLIDSLKEPNIFGFSDSISRNKEIGQKLMLLEILFLNQEEPAKVFNILAKNPYFNFELVKKMADYDVLVKSGKIDYETALLDLCLNG